MDELCYYYIQFIKIPIVIKQILLVNTYLSYVPMSMQSCCRSKKNKIYTVNKIKRKGVKFTTD